jgi:hypothetical protein
MNRFLFVCACLLSMAASARADTIARGTVVKVDAGDIYVNLGTGTGVGDGARLRIKRPLRLRDPVTRRWVDDWLPVGAADVTHAGRELSMATLEPDLFAEVAAGDVVEIYVERDEPAAVAPPPPPPTDSAPDTRPLPSIDEDTAAVLAVFDAQRGATLDARIAAWEGYLAQHGGSPYAAAIASDLDQLRELREKIAPPHTDTDRMVTGVEHAPPTQALAGTPLPLVFVLDDPSAVASAWLHYRKSGEPTYRRVLLAREHDVYLRATIPADAVAAPGLEYFVETVDPHGRAGTAVAPPTVAVAAPTVAAQFSHRRSTRVSTRATYASFSTFDARTGNHVDRFYQLETDVGLGLDGVLDRIGAGFGIFQGDGGVIDTVGMPHHTGFQYGYAEGEVAITPRAGAALRLIAGVDQLGFAAGIEGRLRFGDPDGTQLDLSGSEIERVGYLSEVRLQVAPDARVPVGLSVGVTDRPTAGDPAVRLGIDLGARLLPWLTPVVRFTYQGRNAEHAGLGAGLGLDFHW